MHAPTQRSHCQMCRRTQRAGVRGRPSTCHAPHVLHAVLELRYGRMQAGHLAHGHRGVVDVDDVREAAHAHHVLLDARRAHAHLQRGGIDAARDTRPVAGAVTAWHALHLPLHAPQPGTSMGCAWSACMERVHACMQVWARSHLQELALRVEVFVQQVLQASVALVPAAVRTACMQATASRLVGVSSRCAEQQQSVPERAVQTFACSHQSNSEGSLLYRCSQYSASPYYTQTKATPRLGARLLDKDSTRTTIRAQTHPLPIPVAW